MPPQGELDFAAEAADAVPAVGASFDNDLASLDGVYSFVDGDEAAGAFFDVEMLGAAFGADILAPPRAAKAMDDIANKVTTKTVIIFFTFI